MLADKTYCLNSDKTRLVPEDSPEAAFLLVREGCELPDSEAVRYGLMAGPSAPSDPVRKVIRTANLLGGAEEEASPVSFTREEAMAVNISKFNSEKLAAVCAALGIEPGETNKLTVEAIQAKRAAEEGA